MAGRQDVHLRDPGVAPAHPLPRATIARSCNVQHASMFHPALRCCTGFHHPHTPPCVFRSSQSDASPKPGGQPPHPFFPVKFLPIGSTQCHCCACMFSTTAHPRPGRATALEDFRAFHQCGMGRAGRGPAAAGSGGPITKQTDEWPRASPLKRVIRPAHQVAFSVLSATTQPVRVCCSCRVSV